MTSMLHRFEDAGEFDRHRQLAELDMVARSPTAARLVAENYTGIPLG
jgi:p-hydroxybenzoate 3-monooxygenase